MEPDRKEKIESILNNEEIKVEIDKKIKTEVDSKIEIKDKLMKEKLSLLNLAKDNDVSKFNTVRLVGGKLYKDISEKVSNLSDKIGDMNEEEVRSIKNNLEKMIDLEENLKVYNPNEGVKRTEYMDNSLPESIDSIIKNPKLFEGFKYRDGLYKTSLDDKKYNSHKIGNYGCEVQGAYMRDVVMKDYVDMQNRNYPYKHYSKII
jgi:hypothetical protein